MLPVPRRRIVSRGELAGSAGGIYNPGAAWRDGKVLLLCRREIDYRFTTAVYPECLLLDPLTLAVERHWTLGRGDGLAGRRAEDFRLLAVGNELLAVHTLVDGDGIRPVLSRIRGRRLELVDRLELPIATAAVEKNWVLFVHEGRLCCLYKLDPLTILERRATGWQLLKQERNGWQDELEQMLSNSTNLVPFRGGYLGFWHTILHRRYVQGAFLLDRHLELVARTGVLLDGIEVREGFKPGVLYVSALLPHEGHILAFYGEGDAHTGVATFEAGVLSRTLEASPFRQRHVLRRRAAARPRHRCPLCELAPLAAPHPPAARRVSPRQT